jgi:hypothetical protein
MLRRGSAIACLLVACAMSSCSKASNEGEAKQWPDPLPQGGVQIPDKIEIAVKVDSAVQPAITAATLRAAKPDFADEERKAWRIPSLVAGIGPGTVEAVSTTGVSVKFQLPTPEGLEPVLYLTRRGDVIVAALDPKEPFPRYHGQGGRLHRAGDSLPRVNPVARLEITRTKP